MSRGLALAAGIVVVAAGAGAATGPGVPGYDAAWTLLWGDQLAAGNAPAMEGDAAPTPHPLATAVAVLLGPLGPDAAVSVLLAISWLAFGAVVVGTGVLAAAIATPAAGVLAAAIVATRPLLHTLTGQALVDLPFLALVVWAAAGEARRPRGSAATPWLLLAAGLLRPEAWLLAAAYAVWVWRDPARRVRAAAAAAAAPVLWAATDLVLTGDPLHSFTGTRALAADLDRPQGAGAAIEVAPGYLSSILHPVPLALGLTGVAGAVLLGRRGRPVLVLLALGLVAFLVLGVTGLPLRSRYLLVAAVALAVLAAVTALGWAAEAEGPRRRRWRAVGAASLVLLVVSVPFDVDRLGEARALLEARRSVHDDLRTATRARAVSAAIPGCGVAAVPDYRTRPLVMLYLGRRAGTVEVAATSGVLFAYADPWAARHFTATSPIPRSGRAALPRGARVLAERTHWLVAARCDGRAGPAR